jgi:hypothetical protein
MKGRSTVPPTPYHGTNQHWLYLPELYAPPRKMNMETELISNSNDLVAPQGSNKKSDRPPPIIITSSGNISFQQDVKPIA